ncbi:hypothetical protein [Blastococcus sp. SYSU D00695]
MQTVVLLEGRSDVAAVRAVAATAGLTGGHRLVDMGGVTGVHRALRALRAEPGAVRVLGMCDAGEAAVVVRALGARDVADLAAHGFAVCRADLEEELVRALGTDRLLAVLDRLGLAHRLAVLQDQPAWRGRPLADQLHRFAGTTAGRKELLAGALAAELTADEFPGPLRDLTGWMAAGPAPC